MKALHSWLLTEGAHGMISQVEGLAKALNTTFTHKTVRLSFFTKLLPPKITPKQKLFFNFRELVANADPIPDFIISCGRKSVIPNILIKDFIKKKYNKDIKNIHIQDPKISTKYFNFVVAPKHDNPIIGDNVLLSQGALHYLDEQDVKSLNIKAEKNISLILGGPNKYYSFSYEKIKNVFLQLTKDSEINKINIVASRRTPIKLFEKLKNEFQDPRIVYDFSLNKNNYTKSLSEASHIFVTCDSISMISEAAITEKPIYVVQLKIIKDDYRFKRFFKLFHELGIIRYFEGQIENWTYEKLYETKRISNIIIKN